MSLQQVGKHYNYLFSTTNIQLVCNLNNRIDWLPHKMLKYKFGAKMCTQNLYLTRLMSNGMKYCLLLLLLFCYTLSQAQSYKKLHRKAIVADSHNDILSTCIEKHY